VATEDNTDFSDPDIGRRRLARAPAVSAAERDAADADQDAADRDREASDRDFAGEARDRAAERSEATSEFVALASDGAVEELDPDAPNTPAEDRALAAADRTRAAADRVSAAEDRSRAAADRRAAGIELESAHRDDPSSLRNRGLIARLQLEVNAHDGDLAALRERLDLAEDELADLRAIRDALTPPDLPVRPGLDLAAAFLPAAERVSGDFYLVAAGPADTTVLVVGDVVGHGLKSARRAAFVRTAFVATAPFSDDPTRLLSWVNTALIERAGTTSQFVTAACVTYRPSRRRLRWAYAGHPPALWLDDGTELLAPTQGIPLGITADLECLEASHQPEIGAGVLLYTDGLTEARRDGQLLGLETITETLAGLSNASPAEVILTLRQLADDYAAGVLTDDLCLLSARIV
jgi:serine phosphatase RsbU (regulator of sigma subunit)